MKTPTLLALSLFCITYLSGCSDPPTPAPETTPEATPNTTTEDTDDTTPPTDAPTTPEPSTIAQATELGCTVEGEPGKPLNVTLDKNTISPELQACLENLPNLEQLDLSSSEIDNLAPLSKLTNLKILIVSQSTSDVSSLAGLTNLEELDLAGTQVSDLAPLKELKKLKFLYLQDLGKIDSLTPLTGLTNLEEIGLEGTPVDVDEVEKLKNALPNCEVLTDDDSDGP